MTQGRRKKSEKKGKVSPSEPSGQNKKEQPSIEPTAKATIRAPPPTAPEEQYEQVKQVKETGQINVVEQPAETPPAQQQAQSPAVASSETPLYEYTFRAPAQTPTEKPKEKEEAFAKMYDEEFEKVLAQEKAKCAEGDVSLC